MIASQSHFNSFESIELQSVVNPSSLTQNDINAFSVAKNKLSEIKVLLDRATAVDEVSSLPDQLVRQLSELKSDYLEKVNNIAKIHSIVGLSTNDVISQVNSSIAQINELHRQWFEIGSSNKALLTINAILSFDKSDTTSAKRKYESSITELGLAIEKANDLNRELEAKAAQSVVSNYAKIFEDEEGKNIRSSVIWLVVSLVLSGLLILGLIESYRLDWFQISEKVMTKDGEKIVLNLPNLISKLFLISFCVFIISFCFKQYSINKNLQTLNNHRKNALNSYKLFVDSIGKDDLASRNALMLQVAKAIYEHTNSGYLSIKQGDNSSPNVIEFTKFIGESKN
jgi:hypothetical protein